ncbi:MAG: 1-hydroxycarotenoid 3,4-desaturase CrtD [Pseudomonadota bacterium]
MSGTIAIIGAGIGGLTSAAMLAARGYDVTVIEKEDWVGGKARTVPVDGQAIEAGPTVFTMRDVFDQVFHACGARLDDFVNVRQAEVIARHAWDDQEYLDLFADPVRSEEAIGDFAGADAANGYRSFRNDTRKMFEMLDEPMLRGDNVSSPLPLIWRIGLHRFDAFATMRPHQSMWKALGTYFRDPRLRQLFGRYSTYCGSSPFLAPATLMLIAHVEAKGVWLIDGGISALAEGLRALAESKGVTFRTGVAVAQILTDNGGATGVRLANGDQISADAVICNADPAALAEGKFGKQGARSVKRMDPGKRSFSALVWFAHAQSSGFDLQHHNVFFSPDYPREFEEIADGRPPSDPSVYLCAQDRSASCGSAENIRNGMRERIQIIVNAPANGDTHTYSSEEREQCTRAMRNTLARCGLTLEEEMPHQLATPQDWEQLFPATGGALYGRASHGSAASFLRQGPRTRIPRLYCAGGSTHPSAGVPMAALSGLLAVRTIAKDHASMKRFRPAATPGGMSMRSVRTGSTG